MTSSELKIRQRLGKYRIERKLGAGGFAAVYQAMDTVQGIRVALKVPHSQYTTETVLTNFRREIRTTAPLEHDNIPSRTPVSSMTVWWLCFRWVKRRFLIG
jgi:serine/threonine-protein kinase